MRTVGRSSCSAAQAPAWALTLCLVLPALTPLRAQNTDTSTADLSGTIQGAGGAKVVLHLRTLDDNPLRYYAGYEATTGTNGDFHFPLIKPGHYQLEAEPAFILTPPVSVTLQPGEQRTLALSGTPGYSLCGRITENGVPKNNTWVTTYRYDPEFAVLVETIYTHLGPDGSFLIPNLIPGLYYLQGYDTFYPGSVSLDGAKPIVLGPGGVTGCSLEISLQNNSYRATQISGRIAPAPADPNAEYRVMLVATNPAGGQVFAQDAMNVVKPGDAFSIAARPGDYNIVLADARNSGTAWSNGEIANKVIFDSHPLTVRDTPIHDILLTPAATASITGEVPGMSHSVVCPGGGHRASVSILREGDGQHQSVQLDDKNRFRFLHVVPGDYQVFVGPVDRETVYLDSILVNGKPIQGRKFTVAQPQPVTLTINLSRDQAHAPGHLSPAWQQQDRRDVARWEVTWTRPKGMLTGKVLGRDISGITVQLRPARYNSNASAAYTSQLTADGAFQFQGIDPGVYLLRAEGKSFVPFEYGALSPATRGTPIIIQPGAHIQDLTLSPAPFSSVCGRVTDPQGAPRAGIRIFPYRDQLPGELPDLNEGTTDAAGRFRIQSVPPGTYFFGSLLDVNRVVFFSPDGMRRTAAPVRLEAGKDLGCGTGPTLELRVPPNYRTTYSFTGSVIGKIPAIDGDRIWVTLSDADASRRISFSATANLDSENRFSLANVPAGQFLLQLYSAYGPRPTRWSGPYPPVFHLLASQTVQVDRRLKEVVITPMLLPKVTGTVRFSHIPEAWAKYINQGLSVVSLFGFGRAPFKGTLAADGSFSIEPVDAGDYQVILNPLEGRLYIKSIRLNGQPVHGSQIHLNADAAATLEIEVSGDPANVSAHIAPDETLPLPEPSVHVECSKEARPTGPGVVLIPEDLNASPNFGIHGIPPGNYRAIAFDSLEVTARHRTAIVDDKLRQKLRAEITALGVPVTLQPGQTLELSLPDKTIEIERIASRLGWPLDSDLLWLR